LAPLLAKKGKNAMQVRDVMSFQPHCCTPETNLRDAAQVMCESDCGAIPVVDADDRKKPVGIITDRDIACRAVAKGRDPAKPTVGDCMSSRLATIHQDSSIEDCCAEMEEFKVRRLLVVDDNDRLCGIVSQADIALRMGEHESAEVVREISQPTAAASLVY
jgi:CBS domain-containing protein